MINPVEANLEYRGEVKKAADTILEMCKKAASQTPQGEIICFTFEEGKVAKSPYRSPGLNSQLIEEALILVRESVLKAGWENFKFEEAKQIDPLNPSRRSRELSFAPPTDQAKESRKYRPCEDCNDEGYRTRDGMPCVCSSLALSTTQSEKGGQE